MTEAFCTVEVVARIQTASEVGGLGHLWLDEM